MTNSRIEPTKPADANTPNELYTIKQAADRLDLKTSKVRYYCNKGLVRGVKRAKNGYRLFSPTQVDLLHTLHQLSLCGFSAEELKHYSVLAQQGASAIPERQALLATRKQQIWHEIKALQNHIDFIERQEAYLNQG